MLKSALPVPTAGVSFWLLLGSLYVTQFLGLGFFVVALVAILRNGGASLEQLSLVYLLGTLGALKFLWAPVVDRFAWRRLGHYRGWLVLLQILLIVSFLALSPYAPVEDFATVYAFCLLIAALSMTQDIAVDALACRMVPVEKRGMANGLQTAGGLLSFMIGGGLVLMAYPSVGWRGAMWILATGNVVSLVLLLCFREPAWPVTAVRGRALLARVWTFWRSSGGLRWLGMLSLYPTAIGLSYVLITPVLVDAGWTLDRIGLVVNVLGSAVGAISALLTGKAMQYMSRRSALQIAALCQIPAVSGVWIVIQGSHAGAALMPAVGVALFYFFYNPTWTVLATLMMDRANPASAGTDYSVQWSWYVAVQMGVSGAGMVLAGRIEYGGVIGLAVAIACLTAALTCWAGRGLARQT